jgi:diaminopropionate ammonia-lyase
MSFRSRVTVEQPSPESRALFLANRRRASAKPPRAHLIAALGPDGRRRVDELLSLCPAHRPTPLLHLPALAASLGLDALAVKDEGHRLGLGSFKALGGAYAVMRLALQRAEAVASAPVDARELMSDRVRAAAAGMTVTCATDGNHGRSVAAGARLMGSPCFIFMHGGVSPERVAAIAAFGARIIRVEGTYDDSVREAARQAAEHGWTVVSDTAWDGYEEIPLTVMQGYTAMAGEAFDMLDAPPTHVIVQAGVGGVAAAVAAHAQAVYAAVCPQIIVVEPERAACLFASARAGRLTSAPHGEPTIMGMLECHEASPLAWEVLDALAAGFVTVPEAAAVDAMRRLARPMAGDPAVVAGESGCAGFAGLLACLADSDAKVALGLGPGSRILLFNTEGATDSTVYRAIVGATPETVMNAGRPS